MLSRRAFLGVAALLALSAALPAAEAAPPDVVISKTTDVAWYNLTEIGRVEEIRFINGSVVRRALKEDRADIGVTLVATSGQMILQSIERVAKNEASGPAAGSALEVAHDQLGSTGAYSPLSNLYFASLDHYPASPASPEVLAGVGIGSGLKLA